MFTLLIDLDGVLVKDKELNPFPYASEFIEFLRDNNIPFKIVSNNSTRSPSKLRNDINSKGIPINEGEIITPVGVLPQYLRERNIKRIFVIGTQMLEDYLKGEGFEVVKDYKVDGVVIGQDKGMNFEKFKIATSAVFLEGAIIIPVNLSRIVKDSDGLYFPGAGSVAKMIAEATNYKEELPNLGKPSRDFVRMALKGLPDEEVYLISDDIYTDLMGARDIGLKTIFMTTGKYKRDELENQGFLPDFVFNSLYELKAKISEWLS